jgi:succinate-semialdehyde dehydrogenase/glutarate-semialdehyde dehydrogenase
VVALAGDQLLVAGEWRPASSGATFAVEDPATEEVIARVADGGPADAIAALDAASQAQPSWASTAPRERGEILRRAFEAMVSAQEELALLMTLEMGKPLAESRSEVVYAAEFFRWFSEEAVRIEGRYAMAPQGGSRLVVMHQPVGPCLLVTPWNFPAAMVARKVAPAVAAGCTMVLKPAEETPLCALRMARILQDAGLPPGVLNVVTTSDPAGTLEPLFWDRRLRKLSFTGSTDVGSSLLAKAAPGVLRCSMELGGNAPFIVFPDADLDAALSGAILAKMRNIGEACTAANRFYVHESLSSDFANRLASAMSAMKLGRGTEEGAQVGPLVSAAACQRIESMVRDALEGGASLLAGGTRRPGRGHFLEPTVLESVPPGSRLLAEEIFGPVAPVVAFSSEEEVLSLANGTDYGLVAYLYTASLERALRMSEGLEYGMVGVNTGMVSNPAAPFGGIKRSGIGREGGREGIHEYLEAKYVNVALASS